MSTYNDTITLGSGTSDELKQMELDFDWPTMASGSITDTLSITSNTLGNYITSGSGQAGVTNGIYTTITNGTGGLNMPWITTGGPTVGNTIWDHAHPGALRVRGDAEFEGDLKIRGVSLSDRLDAIEQRLNILRPNADLEEKWEKLRGLGKMYRELEAEIIDKQKVWDSLKT